ncbi:hypothetical protein [Methylobacterium brachythecii]|uniref:Uncharacterized protein n=1 Tax=Methylobacterium brachythecii TaxID=1176177 RepID=A0A7W6AK77_9HYPH|nr:hypothetical protein [Methylobacterium brachythecii]MBB3904945.1 hypothetical protein [Methylobacterium brachythecii]
MTLVLGFLSLTLAMTLATGAAAVLWARFVARGLDDGEVPERAGHAGLDGRVW